MGLEGITKAWLMTPDSYIRTPNPNPNTNPNPNPNLESWVMSHESGFRLPRVWIPAQEELAH